MEYSKRNELDLPGNNGYVKKFIQINTSGVQLSLGIILAHRHLGLFDGIS